MSGLTLTGLLACSASHSSSPVSGGCGSDGPSGTLSHTFYPPFCLCVRPQTFRSLDVMWSKRNVEHVSEFRASLQKHPCLNLHNPPRAVSPVAPELQSGVAASCDQAVHQSDGKFDIMDAETRSLSGCHTDVLSYRLCISSTCGHHASPPAERKGSSSWSSRCRGSTQLWLL